MNIKNLLFTTIAIFGFTINTIAQTVPSYVPTNGLVSWWPFDGNANDESANTNNGIVNGPVLDLDRNSNPNSSYRFNSNTINCGNNSNLNLDNLTVSVWLNADTIIPDWQTIVSKFEADPWGSHGIYLFDNKITVYYQTDTISSAVQEVRSNLNISANTWYHIVATHDTLTGAMLYINGVLDSALNTPFHILSRPNDSLRMGSQSLVYLAPLLGGNIDDVGIWNRALTATEVTDLFNAINTNRIIDHFDSNLFSVFPNPAQDKIHVNVHSNLVGTSYTVYTMLGSIILSGKINSENTIVDLDHLSAGNYVFSIGENRKQTFKVLKE